MNKEHFQQKYIENLCDIDPARNYFINIWDDVFSEIEKPINILDIGCGTGVFSSYPSKKHGCLVYGIDSSDFALEYSIKHGFKEIKKINDLNYDVFEYNDNCFEFVLCKDVLEHLVNPKHVVKEASRVLENNGYLLVHVPNHFPLLARIKFLFNNDIDTFNFFPESTRWDFPHIRFFTHEELIQTITSMGFKVVLDLSRHFSVFPLINRFKKTKELGMILANKWPSQYSMGFTILFKKVEVDSI